MRALAVIDGEHYPPVVRDALAALPYDFVAAWLVGGTEKLRGEAGYGVPLVGDLEAGLAHAPDVVVDLSDEPVLGPRERFLVASRVLARGLPYVGADFRLEPPLLAPFERPSLGIIGTGKRVGKTGLSGHAARLLSARWRLVVVAMGRGGPPEPDVVTEPPTLERLLALSREGWHAATDHLEDAALAGVPTVGARRCGGGLAGAPAVSNVPAAAEAALALDPELVLFEGSGSALPTIATGRRVLVASAAQGPALVTGYLNAYRALISDLVVLTMAEYGAAPVQTAIEELCPGTPVVATGLRPRPIEPVEGLRVAFFSTAPPDAHPCLAAHLSERYGADVVRVSGNLAHRPELRAELDGLDADVYLTEIKAAAIDVVAETAVARGARLVFADNDVVSVAGDLDAELVALAEAAIDEQAVPA